MTINLSLDLLWDPSWTNPAKAPSRVNTTESGRKSLPHLSESAYIIHHSTTRVQDALSKLQPSLCETASRKTQEHQVTSRDWRNYETRLQHDLVELVTAVTAYPTHSSFMTPSSILVTRCAVWVAHFNGNQCRPDYNTVSMSPSIEMELSVLDVQRVPRPNMFDENVRFCMRQTSNDQPCSFDIPYSQWWHVWLKPALNNTKNSHVWWSSLT